MTFTGRIRLFLVAVALVPPLLVLAVVYLSTEQQYERSARQIASANLERYDQFDHSLQLSLQDKVNQIATSSELADAVTLLKRGRAGQSSLRLHRSGLDFLEIADADNRVVASAHRPGLIGEQLDISEAVPVTDNLSYLETIEYDIDGRHAAFVYLRTIDSSLTIYCGRYIDDYVTALIGLLTSSQVDLVFEEGKSI